MQTLDAHLLDIAKTCAGQAYNKITGGKRYSHWLTSAEAYLLETERLQIVTFKGTKEITDFFIDATAFPMKYNGHWCHAGFRRAHKSIWKKIEKDLDPDLPLLITGHSLGGALAELSCLFVQHFARVYLITFGKPNVFAKWSRPDFGWLNHQISCVSGSDVVTRAPRLLYRPSVQDLLYFANNGLDYWNPSRRFKLDDWSFVDALEDHGYSVYEKRVDRFVKQLKENAQ